MDYYCEVCTEHHRYACPVAVRNERAARIAERRSTGK